MSNDSANKFFSVKTGGVVQEVVGEFTATGVSDTIEFVVSLNVLIHEGVGTVAIERSFDDGVSWQVISQDAVGTGASYDVSSNVAFNGIVLGQERKALTRLNCTAYTSGTILYRMSQ